MNQPSHFPKRDTPFYFCLSLFLVLLLTNTPSIGQEIPGDSAFYARLKALYEGQARSDPNKQKHLARMQARVFDKLDQHGSMQNYQGGICPNLCLTPDLADWQLRGPHVYHTGNVQWNGFVSRVSADPREINSTEPATYSLMGIPNGGVWEFTTTGNPKWTNRTDNLQETGPGITELLRNPVNPDHIIASTGFGPAGRVYGTDAGLIQSVDNGQNWSPFPLMFPGFNPCKEYIVGIYHKMDASNSNMDIANHFFLIVRKHVAPDELWEYCNGSWYNLTPPDYMTHVNTSNIHLGLLDFTATSNGILLTTRHPYAAAEAFLYRTTYNGSDSCGNPGINPWAEVSASLPGYSSASNQGISVSDAKGQTIFARCAGAQQNRLYRTQDGGATWVSRSNSITTSAQLDIEYSPTTELVYIANVSMSVWDDANGQLRTAHNQHVDIRDMDVIGTDSNGDELVLIANDGGVSLLTYDPSQAFSSAAAFSFRPISGISMPIHQVWGLAITQSSSPSIVAGMMHNHSMAWHNGAWCKFGGGDGADMEINQVDQNKVYFSMNTSIRRGSLNSICNSSGVSIGSSQQWQFQYPLELHPSNQCLLFYGDNQRE